MKRLLLLFALFFFCVSIAFAQTESAKVYLTDLSIKTETKPVVKLSQGSHVSKSGKTLTLNNSYFIRDGKPWFPVMGEMHYVRLPQDEWEESILKMKVSGIDIIATYVFWNYHEEEQGVFDWTEDRDLKLFAELCKKHDIYLFLRIGPWCHGEVRYGGLPDWVQKLEGGTRNDNPEYLKYVDRFFKEIYKQTKGLYFKDDGPIIGTQIENEFRFNSAKGLAHILNLKKIAMESGIDTPYYTATGWPGSNLRQNELIPVWGSYPEAPWSKSTSKLPLSANYLFGPLQNDPLIGNDLFGKQENASMQGYRYPYATAEMGGGNQVTYHRRPVIDPDDVVSLAYVKAGSGANLLGYYMYHGGSNKIGKKSTLQESKATKYPNDYPIISYDFYSPLGEFGDVRQSWVEYKVLHYFLNDFGDKLTTTSPFFPNLLCKDPKDKNTLRMAVRSDGEGGFLFINNYQRGLEMKEHLIKPQIKTKRGELISFPAMTIWRSQQLILPFKLTLDKLFLAYATVQPFCILKNESPTYVFFKTEGIAPQIILKADGIKQIKSESTLVEEVKGYYVIQLSADENECEEIKVTTTDDKEVNFFVIGHGKARNSWKVNIGGTERLCVTQGEIIPYKDKLVLRSLRYSTFNLSVYPKENLSLSFTDKAKYYTEEEQLWKHHRFILPETDPVIGFEPVEDVSEYIPGEPQLPEDDRLDSVPLNCPGPQYFVNFRPVEGSRYWRLRVSSIRNPYISNAYIMITYKGDTGSLYQDGELIADNYYNGLPFKYSLRRLKHKTKEMLLQVVPLKNPLSIYLEENQLNGKGKAEDKDALLKGITVLPQYELTIMHGE
ncbi:beta-galactosidase [Bacteroides sp. 224]|uniref:beta-galactosidase n=1 Tax=Bacteroides sp. 224 TaxID=2302936 RepID=UPI0013D252AD|nr:beta-galactosidase [Bacteroides sp. 224]NDV65658.1 beta-galactosidase [Bacteroides sp. 224]